MRNVVLLAALACSFGALAASAAEEGAGSPPVSTASTSRGTDLLAVVSAVSQKTHRKFLLDPRVSGTVALVGVEPRDVSYPLLLSILSVNGFSTFDQEGVTVIVPEANERVFASTTGKSDYLHSADADVVTVVVPLKNTRAASLVPVLRPLMELQAHMAAVTGHNALVIVDRAANVRRLVSIIEQLEKLPLEKVE